MTFTAPIPFAEAIESRAVRQLLPTELRTSLLSTIPTELRERAMFSAGVTNAEQLQGFSDKVDELLAGKTDRATARRDLKTMLGSLGAPVDETDLVDLRSDARLNLILDTNLQQAQGYGHWAQGQQAEILDQWPAQELIRVQETRVQRDWAARWAAAGGTFFDGRMIALKNDPIWKAISRFGTPYPPFDFNSGMDVLDVDRDTAIEAGLIDRDTVVEPQSRDFNTDLQASPAVNNTALRSALEDALQGVAKFTADGVLRLVGAN